MPTVPAYPVGGRVERAPLTTQRYVTPGAGDISGAIQGAAKTAAAMAAEAARQQDMEDEAAARQLDVQYGAFENTLLRGDGTAENPGYFNLKGIDALNAEDDVASRLEAERERLRQTAGTGQRAEMFDRVLSTRAERTTAAMATHRGQQVEFYALSVSAARASALGDEAAAMLAGGEEGGRARLEAGWQEQENFLRMKGLSDPKLLEGERLKYLSAQHRSVITLMFNSGRAAAATEYMALNHNEMTGDDRGAVLPSLQRQTEIDEGVALGRTAAEQYAKDGNLEAAYLATRHPKPEVEAAAKATLDRVISEAKAVKAAAEDAATERATQAVLDGADPRTMNLTGVPASRIAGLTSLYNSRTGANIPDGSPAYVDAMVMASTDPQGFVRAFSGERMTAAAANMSPGDWNRAVSTRNKLAGGETTTGAMAAYREANARIGPVLSGFGITNTGRTKDDYAKVQRYMMEYLDLQERRGELTPQSYKEAVNVAVGRYNLDRGKPSGAPPIAGSSLVDWQDVVPVLRQASPGITTARLAALEQRYVVTGGRSIYAYKDIPPDIRAKLAAADPGASQADIEEYFAQYVVRQIGSR